MHLYFILDPRGTVAVIAANEDDAWNDWHTYMPYGPSTVAIIGKAN